MKYLTTMAAAVVVDFWNTLLTAGIGAVGVLAGVAMLPPGGWIPVALVATAAYLHGRSRAEVGGALHDGKRAMNSRTDYR